MANKKYTLYFKSKNTNGDVYDIPIVSLPLKELDMYTSRYDNYNELFNSLPMEIKEFINSEFDTNDLSEKFYVTDYDFTPIMNVIFKEDIDVLCIEPSELKKLLENNLMSTEEFQKSLLKSLGNVNNKYEFYKYLYETYVKNNKIKCMIDLYYVSKRNRNMDEDLKYIEAIATDRVNLLVLAKKLSQTDESRRNLTYMFKKKVCNDKLLDEEVINYRKIEYNNDNKILSSMIVNIDKFIKEYKKG